MRTFFLYALLIVSVQAGEITFPKLALPNVLYGVVDSEMNVFFDSITLFPGGGPKLYKIRCTKGAQLAEKWTFVPSKQDVGMFPFEVEVYDGRGALLDKVSSTVQIAPTEVRKDVRLLAIGDSTTYAGRYTDALIRKFERTPSISFKLLGTRHAAGASPENVHEGYSGWKLQDVVHVPGSASGDKNAFFFEKTKKMERDFRRYFSERLGGSHPTHVFILLGINDIFSKPAHLTDEALASRLIGDLKIMLTEMQKVLPEAQFGIGLISPAGTQDAFGKNYGSLLTRWEYQQRLDTVTAFTLEEFQKADSGRIKVIATNANFDATTDYPVQEFEIGPFDTQKKPRGTDALHPAQSGYSRWADSIHAWLLNTL